MGFISMFLLGVFAGVLIIAIILGNKFEETYMEGFLAGQREHIDRSKLQEKITQLNCAPETATAGELAFQAKIKTEIINIINDLSSQDKSR